MATVTALKWTTTATAKPLTVTNMNNQPSAMARATASCESTASQGDG